MLKIFSEWNFNAFFHFIKNMPVLFDDFDTVSREFEM